MFFSYLSDDFDVSAHKLFNAAVVKTDLNGVAVLGDDFSITETLMIDAFSQIVGRFFACVAVTTVAVIDCFFIGVVEVVLFKS